MLSYTQTLCYWIFFFFEIDEKQNVNFFFPSIIMLLSFFKSQTFFIYVTYLILLSLWNDSNKYSRPGAHTIGNARCVSFKQRIYQDNTEENVDYHGRTTIFRRILRSICSESGRDNAIAPLDFKTPARFDNHYYHNIIEGKGLLQSDNVLVSQDYEGVIREHVWSYAKNQKYFFDSFAYSVTKMGNINVLTGDEGEVRKTCRYVNI